MSPDQAGAVVPIIQRPLGATGRLIRMAARLRPVQIANRFARRLKPLRIRDHDCVRIRRPSRELQRFMQRPRSMLTPTRFRFLNAIHDVRHPADWNDASRPRLWTYNLHYFDDLQGQDASGRRDWHLDLIDRWLRENVPPSGTAWEPYPASLRTVNLAKWILKSDDLPATAVRALGLSARAVREQLEYHLLGNHLFANAKALFIAGLCVEGREADSWLRRGRAILEREVEEQVLADGAHFELSPMYHALAVEDALDLVNFARAYGESVPAGLERRLPRMLSWLDAMTHPDGEIAFFNDAATGVAAGRTALVGYASALGLAPEPTMLQIAGDGPVVGDLSASGYARLQSSAGAAAAAVAICDAAAVGPGYLPGHAHADSLSFELSVGGHRAVVNVGTSAYASSPRRIPERSTSSHSTVQLANVDSSEVWDSFRCGARAAILERRVRTGVDEVSLQATHDGYRFIDGRWLHRRTWVMKRNSLEIFDRVFPRRPSRARAIPVVVRFLLHPLIEARPGSRASDWFLDRSGMPLARFEGSAGLRWGIESAEYSPEFGITHASKALVGRMESRGALELQSRFEFGSAA